MKRPGRYGNAFMLEFFKGKKVFITGHTGFKGTWLSRILINAGAQVTGYALKPQSVPNLYDLSHIEMSMNSIIGDIRNYEQLSKEIDTVKPEIVIHLAAQPLVRNSYINPRYTYETNVMGTVNILESIRNQTSVKSFLNVTTDKVYKNKEWIWGYREDDYLDGYEPYSNSKSCSELVTNSYNRSFFFDKNVSISTARAGNVIGGGDFAKDRIIPDCIRFSKNNEEIIVRNPFSIRPYQHVLDPLYAYLLIVKKQYENKKYSGSYNVGPDENDCINTGKLVDLFCVKWEKVIGGKKSWINKCNEGPHESGYLKLDCTKLKSVLGWKPKWNIDKAVERTLEFTKIYLEENNIIPIMDNQIQEFFGGEN